LERLPESLKDIYNSLFDRMQGAGYTAKKRNVSRGLSLHPCSKPPA